MRKTISLAAFLVTTAVIVPAGWHALDADIQSDGKRLRPLQESFTFEGTRITLDVDRHVVMTGDPVKATLVAYSDAPRQVALDLYALNSSNYEGSRVEAPWVPIDHETIKLTAAPGGGKPVSTLIKLGERPEGPALVDNFKIYVTPHGKKPPRLEGDDRVDYETGVSEGYAAAVGITGWSGDNLGMSIRTGGKPSSDQPFTVAVHIKNTSGQELARAPYVTLSTEAALEAKEGDDHDAAAVTIEQLDADAIADHDVAFRRGQTMVVKFRVTPHKPGLRKMTFLASAFESDEEPGPTTAGAMNARTFTLSDTTPAVAAN
ncbi:MAG TPA: hypothetical protein VFT22_19870 [Kofleriaceae bacterium]|nr:hypothetical protein [Kofleriaceae bacterium]